MEHSDEDKMRELEAAIRSPEPSGGDDFMSAPLESSAPQPPSEVGSARPADDWMMTAPEPSNNPIGVSEAPVPSADVPLHPPKEVPAVEKPVSPMEMLQQAAVMESPAVAAPVAAEEYVEPSVSEFSQNTVPEVQQPLQDMAQMHNVAQQAEAGFDGGEEFLQPQAPVAEPHSSPPPSFELATDPNHVMQSVSPHEATQPPVAMPNEAGYAPADTVSAYINPEQQAALGGGEEAIVSPHLTSVNHVEVAPVALSSSADESEGGIGESMTPTPSSGYPPSQEMRTEKAVPEDSPPPPFAPLPSAMSMEPSALGEYDDIDTSVSLEDSLAAKAARESALPPASAESDVAPTPAVPSSEFNGSDDKAAPKPPMRIGDKLVELGLISEDQLLVALQEQKATKKMLGAILVDMGFLSDSALGEVLAESSGSKQFNPKTAMLDPALINSIPKDVATRQKIIPVSLESNVLHVAMPDVHNVIALDQVRRYFDRGIVIETLFCSEQEVLELIDKYYDYELSIDGILKEIETGIREKGSIDSKEEGYTNPTVRLVNAILVDSIKRGASDIHFEPEGQFLRLRYRIDGDLQQIRSFHRDYWSAIAVRIKIISAMNIAATRMPQDGRISFEVLGREVDFRVATQPTVYGENIVMRLLDKTKSLVPLEKLGFAEHNINLLKKLIKRPEGIIIVTGPTGSGKTTTLYSILNYINSMDVNIMTLEDPVEYQLPLIRQTNIREGTIDFLNGIKSLMRQDPDIIFIGEVRDEDTALMSVRAALTGHQVYTTLHTNDAMGAIPRLGDIGVPAHLLAGSLICTLAQRLARKLCEACKKARLATPEEARILGFPPEDPPTVWDPVGCPKCNNKGHKGRTAIIEILHIDEGLNELISTHATRNSMMEHALENGFVSMMDDGIDKVVNGEIDVKQLIATIDMTERL